MPTDLRNWPWGAITAAIEAIRRRHYTRPWPRHPPHFETWLRPEELDDILREEFYFEGVLFSYDYEGQDVELRRPAGRPGDFQKELHFRGYWDDDRNVTVGNAHTETSRYEHKQQHIDEDHLDWETGKELMEEVLREAEELY